MPVTMELRENGRVFYYCVRDPLRLSDLIPLYEQNRKIRDQSLYPIHAIANLSEVRSLPQEILSLSRISPDITHPRAGYIFAITASPFVRSIVDLLIRLVNSNRFRVFATEGEAWDAMRKVIEGVS